MPDLPMIQATSIIPVLFTHFVVIVAGLWLIDRRNIRRHRITTQRIKRSHADLVTRQRNTARGLRDAIAERSAPRCSFATMLDRHDALDVDWDDLEPHPALGLQPRRPEPRDSAA